MTLAAEIRLIVPSARTLIPEPVFVQSGLQIRLLRNQVTSDSDNDLRLGEGRTCARSPAAPIQGMGEWPRKGGSFLAALIDLSDERQLPGHPQRIICVRNV
jgi:hypothetical protein